MEGEVSLAAYLCQVSGCMNLSAEICFVPCVVLNKHMGLKAASYPGVLSKLEKNTVSVF